MLEVEVGKAGLAQARGFRGGPPGFLLLIAALWVAFYALWSAFPYIRSGSEIVYRAKTGLDPFPASRPFARRVLILGNSKVLSGFIPDEFDARTGLYSFNLGKPDETHVAATLERLGPRGQLAHTILLTLPWSSAAGFRLPGDDAVMTTIFPFRKLPRDFVLFFLRSRSRGGMAAFYRFGGESVRRMERDRGWYFIEGQSHYPGDLLPDDFHPPSDRPDLVDDPAFFPAGREFARLVLLADRYDLRFVIVPSYHRDGELAPSPPYAAAVAERLRAWPRFEVRGPNYYLFPNHYFSDPVHLNPAGARVYTRMLADALKTAQNTVHAASAASFPTQEKRG